MLTEFEDVKINTIETLEPVVKKIESMIRTSKEYRAYLHYTKDDLNMRFSQTWKNIDFIENKISMEVHHLIKLYDIVMMVGTDMVLNLSGTEYLMTWDIAKEVINLHLSDMLPVVCLAVTEHEMAHAGLLDITNDNAMVHLGNYNSFIYTYQNYLTSDEYDIYKKYGVSQETIDACRKGTHNEKEKNT